MRPCCYGFFIRIVIFMDIGNTCGRAPMANAFVKWVVVGALLAFPTRWLLGDATVPDLTLLKVKGNELMANGREFHLRGINWGWWHSNGTKYSEADMQSLAAWGANVIRLGFSYSDLETDDTPPVWKEDGFKAVDEVVQWGKRNGVYVILDMNVAPGGQGLQSYCAGGRDQLWTDSASQDRFVGLWSEIAKRYQDRPEVAAYELMNEPQTNAQKPDPNQVVNMDKRAISAIRTVDFNKVIVVGGDFGSGPDSLTDAMKIADDNILYTFHFFEATGHFHDEWISTVPGATSAAGSQDWTQVDENFTAPEKADQMCVLLRSDHNSGTAWFDDIQVADSHGTVLQSATFDTDPQGFRSERWTPNVLDFDSATGHDKPGSLKVHGTTDYDGWSGQYVPVQAGETYHVTGWVKLDQATGSTYFGAAFFQNKTAVNRDAFQAKMAPAVDFAKKYNVPVYVGAFGCEGSNRDYQSAWTTTCISLFEQNGFGWAYWNDKEAEDPSGMGLRPEHPDGSDFPVNTSLLAALRVGWGSNATPAPNSP
jgi:endoglucanase